MAVAAIPYVIAGVSAAVSYSNSSKMAAAQEKAAKLRNEQLVDETIANYDELAAAELDTIQNSNDRAIASQRAYIKEKGRINVMAAAMGTKGQSISGQLRTLEQVKYRNYATILEDRQASQDNIRARAESLRFGAASRADVRPISRPSSAAAALTIASKAVQGYSAYQSGTEQSDLLKTPTSTVKAGG